MSILSFEFLLFSALVAALYYLAPLKARSGVLALASIVFALCSGWSGAAYLGAVTLLSWSGALGLTALQKREKETEGAAAGRYGRLRRWVLAFLLASDLGAMAFVKYAPPLWGWTVAPVLGVSYFTFQSAGYLIDVYRGKARAARNPLNTFLFVGYFLQLSQGPISTWKELEHQLTTGHRLEPTQLVSGFQLMLWGYFKKLVIADRLAATTAALLQEAAGMPGWFAAGGVALYTIRLYADFSGGMDIVRGISRMLGVELPENFRRPFFAQSVAEYWRRWHITLGAWFRSYLLYPLATSRAGLALSKRTAGLLGKKTARQLPSVLATVLVFLLIGVWHMASWNAVVYGAYFGVLMAASMLLEPVWKKTGRALRIPKGGWMKPVRLLRTWLLILLAQYFAFTNGPKQGLTLLKSSFVNWNFSGFAERCAAVMPPLEWGIAGIALLVLLAVDLLCERKKDLCGWLAGTHVYIRWPVLVALIVAILVFGCYGQGFDGAAFLYTQF